MTSGLFIKAEHKNIDKINAVFRDAQGRARERVFDYNSLESVKRKAEAALGETYLRKKEWKGARFYFSEGGAEAWSKNYKYDRDSSMIGIERGSKDWYVIEVARKSYAPNCAENGLVITDEQCELMTQRYRMCWRTYTPQPGAKQAPKRADELPPNVIEVTKEMLNGLPRPTAARLARGR